MEKPNLKKNQEIELNIEDLSYEGKGVAKVDDFTLFVDNALPNETVKAVITRVNKNFGFARTLEVLKDLRSCS